MEYADSYINILIDTLKKKKTILKDILKLTKEQATLAQAGKLDMDQMNAIMDQKDKLIAGLSQWDDGFNALYTRVREELTAHRQEHQPEILQLQNLIRETTEIGTAIEVVEHQNKNNLSDLFLKEHRDLAEKRRNINKTTKYHKQVNGTQYYESVLFNQKK